MLIVSILLFFILNAIPYYRIVPYGDLVDKWASEDYSMRLKKRAYIVLYFILSQLLFVLSGNVLKF